VILDNHGNDKAVFQWIQTYTQSGEIDAVTGYFTVGALAFLSDKLNDHVSAFRMIVGDIVSEEIQDERPLDLLNETIAMDAALELKTAALKAVAFLQQEKVSVNTLEPNFCHAKTWLFHGETLPASYYITGSSNLTEAGIGLRAASNHELNLVGQGTEANYQELKKWFADLWARPECKTEKTVDGRKVNFKQYLIDLIRRLFVTYTPRELYYKTLFELFGRALAEFEDDKEFSKAMGRLENTEIYRRLYDFQRKGLISLIKMLQEYNGAILADAVGLGKTWSALGVMKFYSLKGYDVLLLCPKKLQHNWQQYLKNRYSCFEPDKFDFVIRFHTDLQDERLVTKGDSIDWEYFQSPRPKLLVIDESHNLRNAKSNRYRFLVEHLLRQNEEIKVLLLSATPINTSLTDIRNQFKLLVKDRRDGFRDTPLAVNNIDHLFNRAKHAFDNWSASPDRNLNTFIKSLPAPFFKLTDSLIVSRTRRLISRFSDHLSFPHKQRPHNVYLTGTLMGKYNGVEELVDSLPAFFAAYRPAFYLETPEKINVLQDERQRDFFLARMMHVLLIKRLESGWKSFRITLERVYDHHLDALQKVRRFQGGEDIQLTLGGLHPMFDNGEDSEGEEESDWRDIELTLGKREIHIGDIADAGNLDKFKDHLHKDLKALNQLRESLALFEEQIRKEKGAAYRAKSRDEKLLRLMEHIQKKQSEGLNRGNRKVLVFTAYTDTAEYLFEQLTHRGFPRVAMVSGKGSRVADDEHLHKDFEHILQRFCPYTKLFLEKEWPAFEPADPDIPAWERYEEWREWIHDNEPRHAVKLDHPIDILISTDCLSEGQNLQDCDTVVNYDIHWNPVRAIQRLGRIDRLGSPNDRVFAVNFWPTKDMNKYLDLQRRVENRMAQMRLTGSEVPADFTPEMMEILHDEQIHNMQEANMLKQLESSWDEIETDEQSLGFDKLSLENYRQDLMGELNKADQVYADMPLGVYTGFRADSRKLASPGLIALLGHPARKPGEPRRAYERLELICVDRDGVNLLPNAKEVLDLLQLHKDQPRDVPPGLDDGRPEDIQVWKLALINWLKGLSEQEVDGEKMAGSGTMDLITQLQGGVSLKDVKLKPGERYDERFQPEKFDLVLWFAVTPDPEVQLGREGER
jgi:ERCC4-related helicase